MSIRQLHVLVHMFCIPQLRVRKLCTSACYVQVMLLALQAGGVGLNLTSANHVFMLDIHWNPALEVQAADRCHRVGQTRDVYIHRYLLYHTLINQRESCLLPTSA